MFRFVNITYTLYSVHYTISEVVKASNFISHQVEISLSTLLTLMNNIILGIMNYDVRVRFLKQLLKPGVCELFGNPDKHNDTQLQASTGLLQEVLHLFSPVQETIR